MLCTLLWTLVPFQVLDRGRRGRAATCTIDRWSVCSVRLSRLSMPPLRHSLEALASWSAHNLRSTSEGDLRSPCASAGQHAVSEGRASSCTSAEQGLYQGNQMTLGVIYHEEPSNKHVIYSLLLMAISLMLTTRHDCQTKLYKTNNDSLSSRTYSEIMQDCSYGLIATIVSACILLI